MFIHRPSNQARLTRPEDNRAKNSWGTFSLGCFFLGQFLVFLAALVFLVPAAPPSITPTQPLVTATAQFWPTPQARATLLLPATATPLPPVTAVPPPPAHPIALRGVEITQGIQVFNEPEDNRCRPGHPDEIFCNNSMPLVAGRRTLVRVYLACRGSCPVTGTTVRLRLLKGGQEQFSQTHLLPAEGLQRLHPLPLSELRLSLDNSVNFELDSNPGLLDGLVTLEMAAGPEAGGPAAASYVLTKEFVARKPLRVAYLPIQVNGLIPQEQPGLDYWLLRMYPTAGVEYYRLPVPDMVWEGDLTKGEVLRRLLYVYWLYAQYHPAEMWPDQLFGWLPEQAYNGGTADPFWCPNCNGPHSSRVAFGGLRPEQDIGGPRILVHEIAHNLGAQHAWSPTQAEDTQCFRADGVDIQVDPAWPYTRTPRIQEFGIDLYSQPPLIYSPSAYDMMAYCTYPWISPYTYRKIFESPFLQPDALTQLSPAGFKPEPATGQNGTLLVSGIVYPDGTVGRPEIVRLENSSLVSSATAFTPPAGNDYCVTLQDERQASVAQHCFDLGFTDLETGQTEPASFFVTLPAGPAPEMAQVVLSHRQTPLAVLTPSNHTPQVTLLSPNGGEVWEGQQTITWQADDADGDTLRYDLLYSPDAGQSWLPLATRLSESGYSFSTHQIPASQAALLRVIASDGFFTGQDETEALFTVASPPANSLSLVGSATVAPGQVFEVSVVAHGVTDPGLFGVQFKLNFDPERFQAGPVRLHPDLSLAVSQDVDNGAGQVRVVASRQGQVQNLTGDLTLATLTLTAGQVPGETRLSLAEVQAGARGGIRLEIPRLYPLSLQVSP